MTIPSTAMLVHTWLNFFQVLFNLNVIICLQFRHELIYKSYLS